MTVLDTVRAAAKSGNVVFGGDSVFSMGGVGVDGADVEHCLRNASSAVDHAGFVVVTGPTRDGGVIRVTCRVATNPPTVWVHNVAP